MNRNTTKKFSNFGEQLSAIYNAGKPGGYLDGRLNEVSGANTGLPSDGGFLIQPDFATELLSNAYSESDVLSKVKRITMSRNANTLKINGINEKRRENGSRWGGIQVYWEKEAEEIIASKPSFRQIIFNLKKLSGLCYATDELLEDASALATVIQQSFTDEFNFNLTDKVFNGSGSGEPLGILNSDALVTVAKETDQTDALCAENLIKMLTACYDKNGKAEWYLNQELLPYLYTLKIGKTPVYIPGNSIANAPHGTLFGKPVNIVEQLEDVGAKGDILLADMSQYILVDKGDSIRADQSIHVRFIYDETAFRFIYRVDGQPAWNSTLTPYRGSIERSPFVTLEARTE